MKRTESFFKINEVSKLYGIGIDSLRYYEDIGLLVPHRGPTNNYRYYSYQDLMKLNLIVELRKCGFKFTEIKGMFGDRNLHSTLDLLNRELSIIDREIEKMEESKEAVIQRINGLESALSDISVNQITVRRMPERKCLHIVDKDITTVEIDYYVTEYIKRHAIDLSNLIGRLDGYRLDRRRFSSPERYVVSEAFIVNNNLSVEPSFTLPAGDYLSVAYNGATGRSRIWGEKLLGYAETNGLETEGDLFEFAVVDYYETDLPEEYVTVVQIKVNQP